MPEAGAASGEERLIQGFMARLAADAEGALALKDDCAILSPEPGHDLVLTTDAVAAGVHFFADDGAADIGWKALAVNVSDLAAKGARPLAYLMALSFPEAPPDAWMEGLVSGLGAAQAAFGCRLVGGDTDRRPGPVTLTITAIGSVARGSFVRRGAAAAGERIYVSGTLGDAALGLALRKDARLAGRWALTEAGARHLIGRYLRPEPRLGLGEALRAHASAAMDISDGLAKDLARLVAIPGLGAEVEVARVPCSPAAKAVLAAAPAQRDSILAGGDDYEILATVPERWTAAFEAAARAGGVPVTCIGNIVARAGVRLHEPDGREVRLATAGYDHFDR